MPDDEVMDKQANLYERLSKALGFKASSYFDVVEAEEGGEKALKESYVGLSKSAKHSYKVLFFLKEPNNERLLGDGSPFHCEWIILHALMNSFGITLEGISAALEFHKWT